MTVYTGIKTFQDFKEILNYKFQHGSVTSNRLITGAWVKDYYSGTTGQKLSVLPPIDNKTFVLRVFYLSLNELTHALQKDDSYELMFSTWDINNLSMLENKVSDFALKFPNSLYVCPKRGGEYERLAFKVLDSDSNIIDATAVAPTETLLYRFLKRTYT